MNKLATLILVFGSFLQAFAQENSILEQIAAKTKAITTLQGGFTQEKHLELLDEVVVSKGSIKLIKPSKLAWDYSSPTKYSIIVTESKTWIKNEKGTKSYNTDSNNMFKYINQLMKETFSGEIINNPDFKKNLVSKTSHIITLTPLKGELLKYLKDIKLEFDKTTLELKSITMVEAGGDYTLIQFTNLLTNKPIDAKIFDIH